MTENRPKVGIGVFVFRDGKFVMGQRRGSHGEGSWSIPGGTTFKERFHSRYKKCGGRVAKCVKYSLV